MDNRYVAALHLQPARRFESEQAAPDHNRFLSWCRAIEQRTRVVQIAKDEHAFFFHSVHRRDQWRASRCDQEFVERRYASIIAGYRLAFGSNICNSNAETQLNAMFLVPLEAIQLDFIRCFLAGKHR